MRTQVMAPIFVCLSIVTVGCDGPKTGKQRAKAPVATVKSERPSPTFDLGKARMVLIRRLEKHDIVVPHVRGDAIRDALSQQWRINDLRNGVVRQSGTFHLIGGFSIDLTTKTFAATVPLGGGCECDLIGEFVLDGNSWNMRINSCSFLNTAE